LLISPKGACPPKNSAVANTFPERLPSGGRLHWLNACPMGLEVQVPEQQPATVPAQIVLHGNRYDC
jgi:hypothetical protein